MESQSSPGTETQPAPPPIPLPPRKSVIGAVFVFFYRLLLLGFGGSLAWLLGVAIANFYPAQTQDPPLQEIVMQRSRAMNARIKRLHQLWIQDDRSQATIEPIVSQPTTSEAVPTDQPAPTANTSTTNPNPQPAPTLSDEQRQQLKDELIALQADLRALSARTTDLEVKLGDSQPNIPLATRIQDLAQQLSPTAASPTAPTAAAPVTSPSTPTTA
ncbi:MAG: hypothetical protein F6K19_45435, partial [Cyanothece sp. SIO1E1]|nr:hypothetical protein [Cyanothece sp. SIO1E1]